MPSSPVGPAGFKGDRHGDAGGEAGGVTWTPPARLRRNTDGQRASPRAHPQPTSNAPAFVAYNHGSGVLRRSVPLAFWALLRTARSLCAPWLSYDKRTTTKRKPAQSLEKFLHLLKYLMSRISFSSPFSKRAEGETFIIRPCMPKHHGAVKWRRPRTLLVWEYLGILVKNSKKLV